MSAGYAQRLAKGVDYGVCGLPERIDNKRVLTNKINRFVEIIKKSSYIVAHTGAGISTAAGIPDFRGPQGVWTREKQQQQQQQQTKARRKKASSDIEPETETEAKAEVAWEAVMPTTSHMFLLALHQLGKLQFIVSQNVDSLHLRSGIPRSKLAELHGNVFKETCPKCSTEYFRPFDLQGIGFKETGRVCSKEGCDGNLRDELLDWEDALPDDALEAAEEHCKRADLALCLGTSLRVTVQNGGKLCIVNLQATEKDNAAHVRVFDYCDHFILEVAQQLAMSIPLYVPSTDFVVTKSTVVCEPPFFTLDFPKKGDKKAIKRKNEEKDDKSRKKQRKEETDTDTTTTATANTTTEAKTGHKKEEDNQ